jgi:hypothetical protein
MAPITWRAGKKIVVWGSKNERGIEEYDEVVRGWNGIQGKVDARQEA